MKRNHTKALAYGALFVLAFHHTAYGYLDPGTGSMVLQSVVGGALAGAMTLAMFWRNVKDYTVSAVGKLSRRKGHGG